MTMTESVTHDQILNDQRMMIQTVCIMAAILSNEHMSYDSAAESAQELYFRCVKNLDNL